MTETSRSPSIPDTLAGALEDLRSAVADVANGQAELHARLTRLEDRTGFPADAAPDPSAALPPAGGVPSSSSLRRPSTLDDVRDDLARERLRAAREARVLRTLVLLATPVLAALATRIAACTAPPAAPSSSPAPSSAPPAAPPAALPHAGPLPTAAPMASRDGGAPDR